MKFKAVIRSLGNSMIITIPKFLVKQYDMREKDVVSMIIADFAKKSQITAYTCVKCSHIIHISAEDDKYCTSCGCKNLREVENDAN